MAGISEFSLTKLVSGIKKKDFTSEEVTKSFINNSKKSKKLNAYITECFDVAIESAKNFDKKKDHKGLLPGIPIAVKDLFCTKNIRTKPEIKDTSFKPYGIIDEDDIPAC